MKVCFFARVKHRSLLERVEFYQRDIDILRGLGHDVVVATRLREIPLDADVYFAWWWTWAFLVLGAAAVRRRPVVITGVFDYRWPYGGFDYFGRPWWQRALLVFALRRAAANLFVSRHECDAVRDAFHIGTASYCPLVLDADLPAEGTWPRKDFILTIATMDTGNMRRKCIPESIQAMPAILAAFPSTRLILAGNPGTGYEELKALCRQHGVEEAVEFRGVISAEEKWSLLQQCGIYLQPSVYEGFGMAVLEAMCCGSPVVSSPVGAIPELVGDTGLLVSGRSPAEIADAVVTLLRDRARAEDCGRRAARRAREVFPYSRRQEGVRDILAAVVAASDKLP